MLRVARFVVIALAVMGMAGCGGSGSSGNPFAGAYKQDFLRGTADTAMLVVVADNGITHVEITDSTGILFFGAGTTTNSGALTATLAAPSPSTATVDVAGTFATAGATTLATTLSGALTDSVELTRLATAQETPFAHFFSGNYTGARTGSLAGSVSSSGAVSGTAFVNTNVVPISGGVNLAAGTVGFTATGSTGTVKWQGAFFFVPGDTRVHGAGSWSEPNVGTGTWTSQQGPPPPAP